MNRSTQDFRVTFARMADHAIVTKAEFAALLSTTIGSLTQMKYRGQLPSKAFPEKRRDCWYAKDIREWFDARVAARLNIQTSPPQMAEAEKKRTGRPRNAFGLKSGSQIENAQ